MTSIYCPLFVNLLNPRRLTLQYLFLDFGTMFSCGPGDAASHSKLLQAKGVFLGQGLLGLQEAISTCLRSFFSKWFTVEVLTPLRGGTSCGHMISSLISALRWGVFVFLSLSLLLLAWSLCLLSLSPLCLLSSVIQLLWLCPILLALSPFVCLHICFPALLAGKAALV